MFWREDENQIIVLSRGNGFVESIKEIVPS